MKVTLLLLILIASISLSSCDSNVVNNNGDPFFQFVDVWDCPVGDNSSLTHLFTVKIRNRFSVNPFQNTDSISGEVVINTLTCRHSGVLKGTVKSSEISFVSDFSNPSFDFVFNGRGILSGGVKNLQGKLVFTNLDGGNETDVIMSPTDSVTCNPDSTINPNNQYLFMQVSNTSSPTGPPVIFIHGMTATYREWDSLIADLDSDFKSRHNIYVYQYNWTNHISENGQILKDSVLANGLTDPILIAHSMGGLVSRAYVAAGGTLTKLVTLGTPHLGTPLTELGYVICFADYPGVQDMGMNSSFITSMKVNALDVANRTKYYTIAGQVSGSLQIYPPGWVWKEPYYSQIVKEGYVLIKASGYESDGLVPIESAQFDNGNTNSPLPLQQYIDHLHLQLPQYSPAIYTYINGL